MLSMTSLRGASRRGTAWIATACGLAMTRGLQHAPEKKPRDGSGTVLIHELQRNQ
jgi:hypothetical protein